MLKLHLILLLLMGPVINTWAQSSENNLQIDSLNQLAVDLLETNPDSALLLAKAAWAESSTINYHRGIVMALSRLGYAYDNKNQYDSAIYFLDKSLKHRKEHNLSPSGIATMYTWIGDSYDKKNMYERAIINFDEALKIRQKLVEPISIADAHTNLAIAYRHLALRKLSVNDTIDAKGDHTKAIFHFNNALNIYFQEKEFGDYIDICNSISSVYMMNSDYSSALFYLNRAETELDSMFQYNMSVDSNDYLNILADIYTRKGLVFNNSGKADKGGPFHKKAVEINRKQKNIEHLFISLINEGDHYLRIQNYSQALTSFKEAESIQAERELDERQVLILYKNLAIVSEKLNKPNESNFYLKKRIDLENKIFVESSDARLEDAEENIKLESEVHEKILENTYQRRLTIGILIGGLLILILLSIILYFSQQKQKFQKIIIDNQEANHMQHLLSQLEEAEQQILADQSTKQQMLLTSIGKELHDSIGSMLSAAKRELENLRNNLSEIPNKAESQFEHSYGMIDKAIRDLRKISKSPDKLSLEEQLIPSLRELCKNINRIENSPHIELNTYRLEGVKLPAKHELHIFRIIQEAITNIIKHAQATDIQLQLDWADRILSITVEDNGIGFDPKTIKHGVGLDSMRSRTEELNGTFTLDTAPGKGSTLFMEISIPG